MVPLCHCALASWMTLSSTQFPSQKPGSCSDPPFSLMPTICNSLCSVGPCPKQLLILYTALHIHHHLDLLTSISQTATRVSWLPLSRLPVSLTHLCWQSILYPTAREVFLKLKCDHVTPSQPPIALTVNTQLANLVVLESDLLPVLESRWFISGLLFTWVVLFSSNKLSKETSLAQHGLKDKGKPWTLD